MSAPQPTNETGPASERVWVKRLPDRAGYSAAAVTAILDEGLVAHVGFVADGQPYVIPMAFVRREGRVYIHGSAASRLLRSLKGGIDMCLTVTLLDGLVLARSAFHHSMNYRSVVVLGRAVEVRDPDERGVALDALVDRLAPGRSAAVRPPTRNELAATLVLSLPLDEASAKVRTGPPIDDEADYALDVWAGVVPLTLVAGVPLADVRKT